MSISKYEIREFVNDYPYFDITDKIEILILNLQNVLDNLKGRGYYDVEIVNDGYCGETTDYRIMATRWKTSKEIKQAKRREAKRKATIKKSL